LATLSSLAAVLMTGAMAATLSDVGAQQRERLGQGLFELISNDRPQPHFATSGGWRIQVGTFRSRSGALARLQATARDVPELARAGAQPSLYGALTRARFVGLPDEASADALCAKVEASGVGCFVLRPR
jgi:hypothetical protein